MELWLCKENAKILYTHKRNYIATRLMSGSWNVRYVVLTKQWDHFMGRLAAIQPKNLLLKQASNGRHFVIPLKFMQSKHEAAKAVVHAIQSNGMGGRSTGKKKDAPRDKLISNYLKVEELKQQNAPQDGCNIVPSKCSHNTRRF
jgi:hypothetical protein